MALKKVLALAAAGAALAMVAAVLLLTRGISLSGRPGRAPASQPAVVSLDASRLGELRAFFNGQADRTRVLVMLSPT